MLKMQNWWARTSQCIIFTMKVSGRMVATEYDANCQCDSQPTDSNQSLQYHRSRRYLVGLNVVAWIWSLCLL